MVVLVVVVVLVVYVCCQFIPAFALSPNRIVFLFFRVTLSDAQNACVGWRDCVGYVIIVANFESCRGVHQKDVLTYEISHSVVSNSFGFEYCAFFVLGNYTYSLLSNVTLDTRFAYIPVLITGR